MGIEEIATKQDLLDMERRIMDALSGINANPEDDPCFDMEGAAKYINAKMSTLYKLTSSGEIAYYKVGKSNVLRKSDLDRYLATRRRASAQEISGMVTRRSLVKRLAGA